MAYTINKYDTTPLTVVQDGTIDPDYRYKISLAKLRRVR